MVVGLCYVFFPPMDKGHGNQVRIFELPPTKPSAIKENPSTNEREKTDNIRPSFIVVGSIGAVSEIDQTQEIKLLKTIHSYP